MFRRFLVFRLKILLVFLIGCGGYFSYRALTLQDPRELIVFVPITASLVLLFVKVNAPTYRDTADLAVVRWPDRRMIGWHSFVGDAPPFRMRLHRQDANTPVHGELIGPIAQWIQSMANRLISQAIKI